jgi:type II secretory pathway pseudopilin PulG
MPDWLVVVLIIVAVLVIAGIVYWAVTSGRRRRIESQREEAGEVRRQARLHAQQAGEADVAARRNAEEAERDGGAGRGCGIYYTCGRALSGSYRGHLSASHYASTFRTSFQRQG